MSVEKCAVAVVFAASLALAPVLRGATFSDADWSALGSGMDGLVYALAVDGTNLYAGGYFSTAGEAAATNIAKWNGSAWSALGSGVSGGGIDALAVSGINLYAGGGFTNAGGVAAYRIAKWDGSAWSALGSGVGGSIYSLPRVYALAVMGTNLYAGGHFTNAGGISPNSIAKWDGSAWSPLGSGVHMGSAPSSLAGYVYALAVMGTNLYAGGYFWYAGGAYAGGIAKWDGSIWSVLGSGLAGGVRALAVSGTDLYAGGAFTYAGGVTFSNIAKWNGSEWSALGSGMGYCCLGYERVNALAVSGNDLYAGGVFMTAGGVSANRIAKWDGSAWSALGSGVGPGPCGVYGGEVSALAADGLGHLFVGGCFIGAGTSAATNIAQANIIPPRGEIERIGLGSGSVTLDCVGVPTSAYAVQRATDVQFAANLATLFTTNPPSPDGLFQWTDDSPPSPSGFYRLRRQ